MKPKLKVLHIVNSFVHGGAERILSQLADYQSENYDVSVLLLKDIQDVNSQNKDQENTFNLIVSPSEKFFSLQNLRLIRKHIKASDITHVHLFPAFYLVAIASILLSQSKPIIYTEHSTNNKRRKKTLLRPLEKFIYSRYKMVICVSEPVAFALKKWVAFSNIKMIPNFYDHQQLHQQKAAQRSDFGLTEQDKVMVMVGLFRNDNSKDQITLIKSLQNLPTSFKLLLVGDGKSRQKAEAVVRQLKLEDRVNFLGLRKDVYSILKVCDYGILSSRWEGFPISIIEYIASNLIVIGTNVEGINNIIRDEKCLFELGAHKELAEKILFFDKHADETNKIKEMQSAILTKYSVEQSLQAHHKIYTSVLKNE